MSDTPRTDDAELFYRQVCEDPDAPLYLVPAEFARKLECELYELSASVAELQADRDRAEQSVGAIAIERDEALARAAAAERDAERYRLLCSLLDGSGIFEIPFNANDTFGYACADCVSADTSAELNAALTAHQVAGWGGVMAWMEDKSGGRVIKEHRDSADAAREALRERRQT